MSIPTSGEGSWLAEAVLPQNDARRTQPRNERRSSDSIPRSGLRCPQSPWSRQMHADGIAARARELSDCILASPTAAEALCAWCEEQGFRPGRITYARRDRSTTRFPDDRALDALGLKPHEGVETRCVSLLRGDLVLAEADNWLVPNRLPPHIRIVLRASNVGLDAALRTIGASRRIVFVRFAISVPEPSAPVLEHRAVFHDRDRCPLAVVSERYHAALFPDALNGAAVLRARRR